jgi:DNA-binding CsgD family transcriptional regulator
VLADESRDLSMPKLSRRETEVLEMVSQGATNAEAARDLGVTVHAVKFHLASAYRKLGVANRTQAAVKLIRAAEIGRDPA